MSDGFEVIEHDEVDEAPNSRRRFFQMGAVGVAAIGAAAAANALEAGPAGAATGGNMIIGANNSVTTAGQVTAITNGQIASTNPKGSALLGTALGNHIGVEGVNTYQTPGSIGVYGVGAIGVQGVTNGGGSIGGTGPGVLGVGNADGVGVQAANTAGPSLYLEPFGSTTLPATSSPGEFIVLSDGSLHYSYASDSWVPLTGVVPITPVRVINTTNGTGGITGPLAAGPAIHTSSAIAGTAGIPAQAIGIVANFAISGVGGALLNGLGVATIFPAGASTPATANINAGAGCFAISNSVTVAFGTGGNAGKVSIVWSGGGSPPNIQAFLDVTGYIL